MLKSPNHSATYYSTIGVIFDVAQQLFEVEVLEENAAHVVGVDRVQNLILCQGFNPQIRVLIVVSLVAPTINPLDRSLSGCTSFANNTNNQVS